MQLTPDQRAKVGRIFRNAWVKTYAARCERDKIPVNPFTMAAYDELDEDNKSFTQEIGQQFVDELEGMIDGI